MDTVPPISNRSIMTDHSRIPDKPALEGLEAVWGDAWEREGAYRFDRAGATRETIYSIDTPPPTASGSLHIGHVFSFTHTDLVARYQRMRGRHVFYPMGWDDNGLPTERRVQNYYGVRCDPTLPYDPDFVPPFEGGDNKSTKAADQQPISRRNFIELCERLTVEDEQQFEALFRQLGLSVDWKQSYRTIADEALFTSQLAFVRNVERGEAYQALAPTLWDVTFRTAVAQAELEDREQAGHYHRVSFHRPDGGTIEIETSRPELIPACVALVAHPDDERYQPLFGTTVTTPVFGVEVPVVAHHLAQKDKGTGIAMICTFGDVTDVVWWRELDLPNRAIIGFDGRVIAEAPDAITSEAGRAAYAELAGKTTFSAKQAVVEQLRASGDLLGEPTAITHPVKFYEKGDRPLEIVSTRQWYIVQRRARRGAPDHAARARPRDRLAPRLHARALRELGQRPLGRLAHLPSAVLRRADPRVVSARRRGRSRVRRADRRHARPAPGRPLVGTGAGVRRVPARRARRLRRRARHHGHLGHLVADAAAGGGLGARPRAVRPRVPVLAAPPGPGHHPHVAVLDRAARAARARRRTMGERRDLRLHRRPRPQEDVEVEGQRRDSGGPARAARLRRGALLGGIQPAWARMPRSTRRTRRR